MPLFELAIATAVFTLYGCFSCNVLSCGSDDDDRGHGRPYPASPTRYGSTTTQPAHRPLLSPSYHEGNFSHPTRSRISQQPEPPRLPVVPHTAALTVRAQCPSLSSSSRRPTPALQSTSSRDPHAHNKPRERETIRRAPLASLSNLSVPQPDEGQNVDGIITGEDLREQARRRKDEMRKANKLADRARREGNRDAKNRYERDALVQRRAMESLNKAAAKLIFKEKNKGHAKGTVDLHGLSVPEALEYAKEVFQSATLRADSDKVVRFIVGKGLHSEAGKPKIRPALENLCDERGYIHSLDPRNAGVLIVQC